jgi:hypothetical protein
LNHREHQARGILLFLLIAVPLPGHVTESAADAEGSTESTVHDVHELTGRRPFENLDVLEHLLGGLILVTSDGAKNIRSGAVTTVSRYAVAHASSGIS